MAKKDKVKKPFFKRIWFWVLVVVVTIVVGGGASGGKPNKTTTTSNSSSTTSSSEIPSGATTEQTNALRKAEFYSNVMHMSKASIYNQLTYEYGEKFSAEDGQWAVDNLKAD